MNFLKLFYTAVISLEYKYCYLVNSQSFVQTNCKFTAVQSIDTLTGLP